MTLPSPAKAAVLGHLPRWGAEPLALLEEGAELARASGQEVFALWLGRPAVVGFSPDWNRTLLTDLHTFRSRGSFSGLVPHLAGGVILSDAPEHAPRRRELNPGFDRTQVSRLMDAMQAACPDIPREPFDALSWADRAVLRMLNAAYFDSDFDAAVLHAYLAPLRRGFPAPMLPNPLVRRRFDAELSRLAHLRREEPRPDLLSALLNVDDGLTEARISLAAAHDTTTHALAYALWFTAKYPQWHAPEHHPALLKEVLRLYPPGWMGSRQVAQDTRWNGIPIRKGTLALYSPYLSGRDPQRWPHAADFRPERWTRPPPAWAYLPFGGGERTCLGLHLAQGLILTTLKGVPPLRARWGHEKAHPGLTLGPRGPLWVQAVGDSLNV